MDEGLVYNASRDLAEEVGAPGWLVPILALVLLLFVGAIIVSHRIGRGQGARLEKDKARDRRLDEMYEDINLLKRRTIPIPRIEGEQSDNSLS